MAGVRVAVRACYTGGGPPPQWREGRFIINYRLRAAQAAPSPRRWANDGCLELGAAVANEEHVKRLKQGVAEWNAWREETGPPKPDFSGANLHGANLSGTNLTFACLTGAYLDGASLTGAYLDGANLTGAYLAGADLTGAYLDSANLRGAILLNANLRGAILLDANLDGARLDGARLIASYLTGASLTGADLTGASLFYTVLGNVDLTCVVGLERCRHLGPSVIDHQTLHKSGRLPLSFLRGVGLPDRLIEYLPSLLNQAIQYFSCFISYSTKDQDFADRIHADLQNKGVRCWFAPHDMPIGGKILDEIDAAIRLRDKVLLILSEHSIKSDWVEDEVTKAFEEERKRGQIVLFPLRLDDTVMDTNEAWAAKLRAQRHIGDFRHWKEHDGYTKSFQRVLRDLKCPAENAAALKP